VAPNGEDEMFTMQDAKNERWTDQDKFWTGYCDGFELRKFKEFDGVEGQAYDRGYEVGMNEQRDAKRAKPKYEHWGDDSHIGETVGLN
jgi:hypothetical protein